MYIVHGLDTTRNKTIYLSKFPSGYFGKPQFSASRDDACPLVVLATASLIQAYQNLVASMLARYPTVINVTLEEINVNDPANAKICQNAKSS